MSIESRDQQTYTPERIPGTVEVVDFEAGERIRLVRSVHISPNSPEEVGRAGALAIETGMAPGVYDAQVQDMPPILQQLISEDALQYGPIVKFAREHAPPLPIFLVDITATFDDAGDDFEYTLTTPEGRAQLLKGSIHGVLALGLYYGVKNTIQGNKGKGKEGMTRRGFMARAAGVVAAIAGTGTFMVLGRNNNVPVFSDVENYIHAHAEDASAFTLRLRNLIMAEKLHYAMQTLQEMTGQTPDIAMFVGMAHVPGLKEALQMNSAERTQLIQSVIQVIQERNDVPEEGRQIALRILNETFVLPMLTWNATENKWDLSRKEFPPTISMDVSGSNQVE